MRHGHAGSGLSGADLNLGPAGALAAAALDAADPLAKFAAEFYHPSDSTGRKILYFAGHSLGLQPKAAATMVEEELADWRHLGVLGHHDAVRPWIPYHERASVLAELVGAAESEVVAMNSLTMNLHLMMVSFFRPEGTRNKILIERSAFPSDRYAVVSQLEYHGLDAPQCLVEIEPRAGERNLRTEDIIDRIALEGSRLALVLLPGVQYLTGQAFDLPPLIAAAHRVGAMTGLDLAHAIGNIEMRLHDWKPDFAVWCSYKYLNAGPGAVGGCFVNERHGRDFKRPRFAGWWGHNKADRFLYDPQFDPIDGAQGWQLSNPPILSTAPLLASLDIFNRAGMPALRKKSIALTGFMRQLIQQRLPQLVEVITPDSPSERGCQLSLRIARPAAEAKRCQTLLTRAGVVGDWREPDVLRLAPIPLYNSFADVAAAVEVLARAISA